MPENPAETIVGPSLIGVFINCILFGIVLLQVHTYYCRFCDDSRWLKFYIGVVLLVDAVSTAVLLRWMYKLLVENFCKQGSFSYLRAFKIILSNKANTDALTMMGWMTAIMPFLIGIQSFMTQMFFTWRLYTFARSRILLGVLTALSLASLAGGLGLFIVQNKHLGLDLASIATLDIVRLLTKVWLVSAVLADISISGALIYYLHNSRTGLKQTNKLINKIIKVVIATGLATAIVAAVDLTVFLALRHSSVHTGFEFPLAQLYPISLLSNLHARHGFRTVKNAEVVSPIGSSFLAQYPDEPLQFAVDVRSSSMV